MQSPKNEEASTTVKNSSEQYEEEVATEQSKKDLARKSAVNTFMQSYAVTDSSARAARGREQREGKIESSPKARPAYNDYDDEQSETSPSLRIAAVISIIVIAGLIVNHFFPFLSLKNKKNETLTIMQTYQNTAEEILERDISFNSLSWSTSDEALTYASNLLNDYLEDEKKICYEADASFATTGTDAWGNPMYVTALKQNGTGKTFKYDFYIISGGKNGVFDTTGLRLDADDVYAVLYCMPQEQKTISSVAGFDSIVVEPKEKSGPTIPIAFDQTGGDGGTTIIQAEIGEILPKIQPPQREGFTFLGYFDDQTGGIMYYDEFGEGFYICRTEQGMTLYAHWEEVPVVPVPEEEKDRITITAEHFVANEQGSYPAEPTKTTTVIRSSGKVNLANLADEEILDGNKTVFLIQIDGEDTTIAELITDTTVSIYYQENLYAVTVTKGNGIALVAGANKYAPGDIVTVTAIATEGNSFAMWTGDYVSTDPIFTFMMPNRDVRLQAIATTEDPSQIIIPQTEIIQQPGSTQQEPQQEQQQGSQQVQQQTVPPQQETTKPKQTEPVIEVIVGPKR